MSVIVLYLYIFELIMQKTFFYIIIVVSISLFSSCKILKGDNCDCPHFGLDISHTPKSNS